MKIVLVICGLLLSMDKTFAYGIGQSTHPLSMKKRIIATEFTGVISNGAGVGLQGRYTQRLDEKIKLDAGIGIAGGDRSSRLFAGLDYELFPDYMKQPRVSLKFNFETASEFDNRVTTLSLAPTASKGYNFWGKEGYPFVAIPIGVALNAGTGMYETMMGITGGWTGAVPLEGYEHLTASVELNLGVKDTYTGVFLGIAYPIN